MFVKETPQHAPDCPAGAHQQDAFLPDCHAVAAEIAHQPRAVGGSAEDPAVSVETYRVDGPHPVGPGTTIVDVFPGLLLERQGDVQPAAAGVPERLDGCGKFLSGGKYGAIAQRLAGLRGEQRVNAGRQAVRYRVADDGVVIHPIIVQQLLDYRVYNTVTSPVC